MSSAKKIVGWVALVVALVGCGEETAGPPATGSVAGSITTVGDAPVVGAGVLLVQPASLATISSLARTSADGGYRIDSVVPGTYAVFIYDTDSLVSFWRTGPIVGVAAGQVTIHDVVLLDSGFFGSGTAFIAGVVTDAATGQPVSGAQIADQLIASQDLTAQFAGVAAPFWAATDANGRFVLRGTRLDFGTGYGLVPINITKSGFEPFTLVGRGTTYLGVGPLLPVPAPGESLQVEIHLRPAFEDGPAGVLRGQVLLVDAPVAGIRVGLSLVTLAAPDTMLSWRKGSLEREILTPLPDKVGVTDADGRFEITGLRPGTYGARPAYPSGDGYVEFQTARFEIAAAGTTEIELGVVPSLAPTRPQTGDVVYFGNVELEWDAVELPEGFSLPSYRVTYGLDYALDQEIYAMEPHVTIGPIAADAHVRWSVLALAYREGAGGSWVVGAFEDIASFSTTYPPDLGASAAAVRGGLAAGAR